MNAGKIGTGLRAAARRFGSSRLLGLILVAALLALRIADPTPVQALRFGAFDLFQQIKPREMTRQPVAIVDLDDASIEELGQWPWPRDRLAQLVETMTADGAAAIAFDIIFSEPDRLSPARLAERPDVPDSLRDTLADLPDNDEIFAQAIARSRVVAGQTSVRLAGDRGEASPVREVPHAILGDDPTPFLQKYPRLLQNLPIIEDAALGHGVFSTRPDPDGIYRRAPLVLMVQDNLRLGLAPELLRAATGGEAFAVRTNAAGIEGVVLARQLVPTAGDGSVWPYLTPSSETRYVSAADILTGRMPQGRLAGHLVLVGTSAIGLEDFRPTPLGVSMAGVEIHAQILENILAGTMLERPSTAIAVELVITALLGLVIVILVPAFRATFVMILAVVVMAGYAGASWYAFDARRLLMDPTFPILAAVLTLMLMASLNYLREERMRRQIRSAFGQYVSPDLVDQLSENPDALTLGGERKELTLLFSDVRGFTTIAESYRSDPVGLTHLMNRFLTALSNAILAEKGTIDKFMGDAVMAFWNAPLDIPDHPHAACRAALAMSDRVQKINRERIAEEGEDVLLIDVGIGMSTGPCTVGNMGSDTRFDYTALGDTVNLASRLEGLSKNYGLGIIISESVHDSVGDDFAMLELDMVRVKGKTLPVTIFALIGGPELVASPVWAPVAKANHRMRVTYAQQDWDGCEGAMTALSESAKTAGLSMDGYVGLYRDRVAAFRETPPPAGWDGVFVATTK
ncbi:MAG: adenylate/guanylate cyclase domain-containing protein [Pseudomonadota bacterium]|nr:adenylate/guanylate cyclase domain-containing protein [Pseudomonadota bacterium]